MVAVFIDDNNFVITAKLKSICINFPIQINESIENHIKFMVSCNESLTK